MVLPWKREENHVESLGPFCRIACCYFRAFGVGNGYCYGCWKWIFERDIRKKYPISSKDL